MVIKLCFVMGVMGISDSATVRNVVVQERSPVHHVTGVDSVANPARFVGVSGKLMQQDT